MVDITVIKTLRDETGHSISKCKEALEMSDGDIERAREVLRERGALAAQKKSERNLGAGVIQSYIHTTNRIGAMVEMFCETDFVARNEGFIALARDVAMHCAAYQPQYCSRDQVPQDVMDTVLAELKEGIDAGKPADIQEKILQGMVDAKMREVILLEQAFLKDDFRTVKNMIDEAVQKFGERIEVGKYTVWVI